MGSKPLTQRLTVVLPSPLLERARNAVFWLPDLTVTRLVEQALRQYLERIERQNGKPYPDRLEPLKRGRPKRLKPKREDLRSGTVQLLPPPGLPNSEEVLAVAVKEVGATL